METRLPPKPNLGAEINRSLFKIIIFAFLYLALAAALSFALKLFFTGFDFSQPTYQPILILFVSLLGFLSFFSLLPLLVKNFRLLFFIIFLGVLSLGSFFYDQVFRQPIFFAGLGGGLLIIFLWGVLRERYEYNNTMTVRLHRLLQVFLPKIMAGVLIFGLAVFYADSILWGNFFVSEISFEKFILSSWNSFSAFLPAGFRLDINQKLSDFLGSFALKKIESNGLAKNLPAPEKAALVKQTADSLLKTIAEFSGVKIDAEKTVLKISHQVIKENFDKLEYLSKNIVIFIFLFSLFLPLRVLSLLFLWIVQVFTFLLFEILLASLFMAILYESRSREVVVL